jgi:small subunit ribosomal protein S18
MEPRSNNYNNSNRNASLYPMQLGGNMMQGGKNNQNQNQNQNKQVAKKKVNPLGKAKTIDYLDAKSLLRFTNDQGKILPKRITGVNAYQQRQITKAIKHARHLALLPFVAQDFN